MTGSEDESEWEYEYDQDSTEDFYLTLDLTTHIPPALSRDKRNKAQKTTTRNSNKSLANAPGQASLLHAASENENESANPTERMQLIGLHNKNPILSYNNAIYSCEWATDLNTQIFLAPPPLDFDPDHPPLRSTPSFDVLGTSSARIVATPATVEPRETAPLSPVKAPSDSGPQTSYTTAEGDVIQQSTKQGLRIELPSTASAARASQAKFLEALSAIKARRGDRDAVPVTNIKVYHPPEGWEEEREEYIQKESARSQKDKAEAAARIARQGKRPVDARTPSASDGQEAIINAEAEQEDENDDAEASQDEDEEDEDPASTSLITRKRRTMRGGNRGGAPSGKRLRQSLGLPAARRDKHSKARPRKSRKAADTTTPDADAAAGVEGSNQAYDEQEDTTMVDAADEDA